MRRLSLVAESVDADALARGELPLAENGTFVVGRQPKAHNQVTSGDWTPGQADCPEARRLRTKSCFGNGGKRGAKGKLNNGCPSFLPMLARQLWTHFALQRP